MKNMSKFIKYLIVGIVLLSAPCHKAEAFLWPPFPGEPSFDAPGNVGKILTQGKKCEGTLKAFAKDDLTSGLDLIKGAAITKFAPNGLWGSANSRSGNNHTIDAPGKKTPGKGGVVANNNLNISENSTNEKEFFEAFHTVFLTYNLNNVPTEIDVPGKNERVKLTPSIIKTAYRQKAIEFKQDMAIDTYLTAKKMEDFLVTIEKTLDRLEKCQSIKYDADNCTFFGMKMEEIDMSGASDPNETKDNTAQMGAARNAFIVATVQDRLLRIIEELTALEAIFQSAKQLDIVDPIDVNETQSSAEDYIHKTYNFAYADSQDKIWAKGTPLMKFNNRTKACENGLDPINCPSINKDKADLTSFEDTSVIAIFKEIDEIIMQAVRVHNLKSTLHQYKNQYRQYLLQKKIHEDTKKLVTTSDRCVVDFLNRHSNGDAQGLMKQEWYGGTEPQNEARYDYAARQGISGELIKQYDTENINITLGTSSECDGYYEENACPAGMERDNTKCCETDKNLCACVMELITQDISNDLNVDTTTVNTTSIYGAPINTDMADTDGLMDARKAAEFEKGSRQSSEMTWKIGRDMLIKTMEDKNLSFKPWADQKMLQIEYLRNKYRNIGLIVKSTDQAVAAFKVASKTAENYENTDNPTQSYIESAALCESLSQAAKLAEKKYCISSESYESCKSTAQNDGKIVTKRTKRQYKDGKMQIVPLPDIVENQKVSLNKTCTYKKDTTPTISPSAVCLTPQCLVQKYYTTAWGNAEGFYNGAKGNGREVAADKLTNVLSVRMAQDSNLENLIHTYRGEKKNQQALIDAAINNLSVVNAKIDTARKNKNTAESELLNSTKRVESIVSEIAKHEQRKLKVNAIDKCAIERKIGELNNEKSCIESNKPAKYSCNTCKQFAEIKPNDCQQLEVSCDKYLANLVESNGILTVTPQNDKEIRYITKKVAETASAKYESIADEQSKRLETLKDRVKELQDELVVITDKFAEDYILTETNAQTALEEANIGFEEYLDPSVGSKYAHKNNEPYRMRNLNKNECYENGFLGIGCKKKGPKRILSDNLETTFTNFIQSGSLPEVMKKELNRVFFSSGKVTDMLTSVGIPNSFVVDETFATLGLAGSVSSAALAQKMQDLVVDTAAAKLAADIKTADTFVEQKVNQAVTAIDTFTKNHKINGIGTAAPTENYLEKPSEDHKQLLATLRNISKSVITGENLFGIPEDNELKQKLNKNNANDSIVDTEFFVGLPARGNNYLNTMANDNNAGRDFAAPKDMLSSLPPLREMFYFSAAEYDEIPQNKDKPVISELLDCKYDANNGTCAEEYLPEIWLHILARPNLRQDRKYQQTFVERSFGGAKLNELVQNRIANSGIVNPSDSDYRAIIGRAGVYPCRKDGIIVDMGGGDKVKDMHFMTRNSAPVELINTLPECQEIKFEKDKVYHLLADHGATISTDREKPLKTTEEMHLNYSELGQLLTTDLKYRPLQKNIQEYLMDKNPANDITRQKAERASFKRNIFGSFLDAVTKEHSARKNVKASEITIGQTMQSLCEQLEELGIHYDNCTTQAMAKDYTDNVYYEKSTQNEKGIVCSETKVKNNIPMYNEVFCKLDSEKNRLLVEAKDKLNKVKKGMEKLSDEAKKYVNERLETVENYISESNKENEKGVLLVDSDEISTIQPDINRGKIVNAVKSAKSTRDVEILATEEALQGMLNQSQAVAYCPIY